MKWVQLVLLCFISIAKVYGLATNNNGNIVVEITKQKGVVSSKVQIISPFTGGDSIWVQTLEKSLNQSTRIHKQLKNGKYSVSVKFISDKNGNLSDILCENNPGFGICEEVIREIKKRSKSTGGVVKPYRV